MFHYEAFHFRNILKLILKTCMIPSLYFWDFRVESGNKQTIMWHFEILNVILFPLSIGFGLKFLIYSIWKPITGAIVSSLVVREKF